MIQPIDSARAPRPGEELPVEAPEAYLRAHPPDLGAPIAIEQFPGAHSNLTYVIRAGVYGLFTIAGIAQQIDYRYKKGLTRDERFAPLILAVAILGRQAARAIDRGRIDRLGD